MHGKNGFVTATKLGTTNEFSVASTKNFAAATKRFVDSAKHVVVLTACSHSLFSSFLFLRFWVFLVQFISKSIHIGLSIRSRNVFSHGIQGFVLPTK